MKNVIRSILFLVVLYFSYTFPVYAVTYQADELMDNHEWTHFNVGDVIEFGDGVYEGIDEEPTIIEFYPNNNNRYSYCSFVIDNAETTSIYSGESFVIPYDCYLMGTYIQNSGHNNGAGILSFTLNTVKSYFHYGDNRPIKCNSSRKLYEYPIPTIEIHEGETKRIYYSFEGGESPYLLSWEALSVEREPEPNPLDVHVLVNIDSHENYVDIRYGEWINVWCCVICPSGRGTKNGQSCAGYIQLNIVNVPGKATDETPDNNAGEDNKGSSNFTQEATTPSTVPTGTVRVSIETDNKTFANIKALNPFVHDSVNQKILADMYASKLRKRASVLTQKNLFPPYGVKNDWKSASHTVRWKDLAVKKGDNIIIVWYTPKFGLHAPTLQFIPATVVEDGVIEFTIPNMGDMSVMSIVKLI